MNAPLSGPQAQIARVLGPLEGARIPGGCEHCDAYQTIEPLEAGVWILHVHHDDGCVFYVQLQAGRAA